MFAEVRVEVLNVLLGLGVEGVAGIAAVVR